MTEETQVARKARAWSSLGLGPLWMVMGPQSVAQQVAQESAHPVPVKEEEAVAVEPVAASPSIQETTQRAGVPMDSAAQLAPSNGVAVQAMSWQQLEQTVSQCTDCALSESRTNTVFGVGDQQARWLIIGEAPGANEDKEGEPFVGEAGQLLNAMLGAMGVDRKHGVFILNVLKCRPPGNRDPAPDEVQSCSRYLTRQIQILKPELVLTMGRFAAQALLQTDKGIGALRGKVHEISVGDIQVPLIAGYHPAYLLRRPEEKSKAWRDLCLARSVCDPAAQE